MEELTFETRQDFRRWLEANHQTSGGIWVIYYKKHTKMLSISYNEAVEEALCFGWIDSKVQTIDDLRYKQVFTPRNPKSVWSKVNKVRIANMIKEGKMMSAGKKAVEEGKKSGQWDKAYGSRTKPPPLPEEFITALMKHPQAWENFNNFAPSYRANYIFWIISAKRQETRDKRIKIVVERAGKNIKPGMI
jgi:uncharacterized protein YdeI (YjbR/CyaY-like superfamily)